MIKYLVLIFAFATYLATAHGLIELDAFVHNKDGTHTLQGTCSAGRKFEVTLTEAELDTIDVDQLVVKIKKICGE